MVGGKGAGGAAKPGASIDVAVAKAVQAIHDHVAAAPKAARQRAPRPAKPAIHDLIATPNISPAGQQIQKTVGEAATVLRAKQSIAKAAEKNRRANVYAESLGVHGPLGFVSKVGGDLAEAAFNTPAGLYTLGKGTVQDVNAANKGDFSFKHDRALGTEVAKQTATSFEHPLRHPGYSLLNALAAYGAVAGGAARIGASANALRGGADVGAALTRPLEEGGSLLHKPPPAPRTFKVGEGTASLHPSRNAGFRAMQALHDRIVQRAITENPQSQLARYGNARLGNAMAETRRYVDAVQRAPVHALEHAGRKLPAEDQAALRLTAEQATPEERLALARSQEAKGVQPDAQAKQIRLLTSLARDKVVVEENGRLVVNAANPRLRAIDAQLARAGTSIDRIVEDTGQMTSDALASRRDRPNVVTATGAPVTEQDVNAGTAGTLPGRQHVSYRSSEPKGGQGPIASTGRAIIGKSRQPISKTQHMSGEALLQGAVPDKTTALVAREWNRQIRYATGNEFRKKVASLGSDTRRTNRDVLVHDQSLNTSSIPDDLKVLMGQRHGNLDEVGRGEAAGAFEKWRSLVFPGDRGLPVGAAAPKNFKWVDRGLLGDLGKVDKSYSPNAFARGVDTVNAAQSAATVYFKPGHIATRAVTNAVTNLIQGSLHPAAMTKAYRVFRTLSDQEKGVSGALAGEGSIHALPAEGTNIVARIARRGQQWWRHIDGPSRFLNLYHVASHEGIRTPAQFKQFLHDAANPEGLSAARVSQIDRVAKDANRGSIAYDRLSPAEKQYLRRAIWFYPWIKGSTVFAGRTILEHPIKSAGIAAVGQVGGRHTGVGPVPFYEKGLFKVGGTPAFPITSNANTLTPFSTPAETFDTLKATLSGHFNHGANVAGIASPFYSGALADALGFDPESGKALKGGLGGRFLGQLEKSNPEFSLNRRLTQDNTGKLFPLTRAQAVAQLLGGAEMPKTTNQSVLAGQAASQGDNPQARAVAGYQTKLKSLGLKASPQMTEAIRVAGLRAAAAAKQPKNVHGRLAADLEVLVEIGKLTPEDRAGALATAKGLNEYQLAQRVAKMKFGEFFDPTGVLKRIDKAALKQARGG